MQAQQVGLLTENHHYIIMTLDAHTIDLEPFQFSGTNFTLLRLVNPLSPLMESFVKYVNEENANAKRDPFQSQWTDIESMRKQGEEDAEENDGEEKEEEDGDDDTEGTLDCVELA